MKIFYIFHFTFETFNAYYCNKFESTTGNSMENSILSSDNTKCLHRSDLDRHVLFLNILYYQPSWQQ